MRIGERLTRRASRALLPGSPHVNNRVQVALSSLPQDVQRQGVNVKKKSSALLAVVAVYSPKHTHEPLFISNYVTINTFALRQALDHNPKVSILRREVASLCRAPTISSSVSRSRSSASPSKASGTRRFARASAITTLAILVMK